MVGWLSTRRRGSDVPSKWLSAGLCPKSPPAANAQRYLLSEDLMIDSSPLTDMRHVIKLGKSVVCGGAH